ncbi:MAG: hypothetical protein KDD66_15725 [Bdellovibrionales bacterium]|nr:hypothetical protein [Bdellovibrionales bacterium]
MKAHTALLALIGMALCLAGLFVGVVGLGLDPLHLQQSIARISDSLVGDIAFFDSFAPHQVLKNLLLTSGATVLILVAVLTKHKLFIVLEVFLVLSGGLFFFHIDPAIKIVLRIVFSVGVIILLHHIHVIQTTPRWSELKRGHLPDEWWGVVGLELLGLGYLTGFSIFHLLGGIGLSLFSYYGLVRGPKDAHAVSLFWLILNIPFALFAAVETWLQFTA